MSPTDHTHSGFLNVEEIMTSIKRKIREGQATASTEGHSSAEVKAFFEQAVNVSDDLNEPASQGSLALALSLPRLLRDRDADWRLKTYLRFPSHRRVVGPAISALKRHLLLPLFRVFHEYGRENFRRQNNLNVTMFACLELLAAENIRLRRDLSQLQQFAETRSSS